MLDLWPPSGTHWLPWLAGQTGQAIGLYLVATFVFDVVHYLLHRFAKSRYGLFNRIGAWHETHHQFFNRQLQFTNELTARNLSEHVVPEFMTRIVVATAGLFIFSPIAVVLVLGFQLVQFILVVRCGGRDTNHVAFETLYAPTNTLLVGPRYHSLHHVYPDAYYSSFVSFFDRIFGTGVSLKDRRVALTGATGAFGSALKTILEKQGAGVRALKFGVDYDYEDYSRLDGVLRETDILVLAHGSKKDFAMQANCDSFVALIERFLALSEKRRFPVEVWALGSEIELHPAWGNADLQVYLESKRAFAKYAHAYYWDDRFIYRHICPAGFNSRMGWAPLSAKAAVAMAMFFIRRGFQYVPVTYTGIALINYFKFLFHRVQPRSPLASNAKVAA
jgi:sterol desaturase/sphingolipid hydroxylase (fatty acid hydroxylase superfamily)